jgi:hypothetical protein
MGRSSVSVLGGSCQCVAQLQLASSILRNLLSLLDKSAVGCEILALTEHQRADILRTAIAACETMVFRMADRGELRVESVPFVRLAVACGRSGRSNSDR